MIHVRYMACDFGRATTRTYKTLKGARKYAQRMVGRHPELSCGYAVSTDGIGRITVSNDGAGCLHFGVGLKDLFPAVDGVA